MDLLCWGNGELGQTGCGGTQDISPEEAHLEKFTMAKLGKVKVLACGSSHSIVVTVDNRIFAWGDGTSGQLGCGERTIKDRPTEVRLAKELNVTGEDVPAVGASIVGVACGSRHSFLWTETGQAYSFGNNFYAQLGYDFQRADFKEHQLAPRLFRSLPSSLKTSQVACGERHTLFALEDGRVAACGHNDCGQIGCGSTENAPVPRFVELAGPVSKVTCGANHNLALTGDGRLHQWGCGRACGNVERNLFLPEEVTAPSSPLRDVAGGRWHSLLLTDGGVVFSWGIGREGQLGLGEDGIRASAPRLLSCSQPVTRLQAGDSYSAAVTAGGELLLWGQIPCGSRVSDHPGRRRLWTPQSVPLAGRKVCDVACGAWHIMVLTASRREKNTGCCDAETERCFRDLGSALLPTEPTEQEDTLHVLLSPQAQVRAEETGGRREDEARQSTEEEDVQKDTPSKREDAGAIRSPTFRSALRRHKGGSGPSSVRWAGERTAVVHTTLHCLPRAEGERCRPTSSTLPQLLTGQAQRKPLAEAQKDGATRLTELLREPGNVPSASSAVKARPPSGRAGLGPRRSTSRRRSGTGAHAVLESAARDAVPRLGSGQHVHFPTYSSHPEPGAESHLSPSPPSEALCPAHRGAVSSLGHFCGSPTSGSRSFK
ncbi:E3 ubiquitin-protein ligase HERC2-like isoform X2 [Betta splendens]|uniref:E3 ubiquitin-protein ligase HERC2-like isoform X2 n=1 Tax=Betta splendens TaxID=158456 RepID=A0A6P7ND02_BETSP|nr:E3 ubiquitin-protein ligase HERC2-like isoform X2 [Betta splendens]